MPNQLDEAREKIIVALDVDSLAKARELAERLRGHVGAFKVGSELFVAEGPAVLHWLAACQMKVFLDLKFHDIPNTVAGAVTAAVQHGAWMINIHASGGAAMCRAAIDAAVRTATATGRPRPLIIGVTVLTSMTQDDMMMVGLDGSPKKASLRLARLAETNGLDGIVASAQEANSIKTICGRQFLIVTPGIRPASTSQDDQKRIMTPGDAIRAGSDYLVIGRPITRAADPAAAADQIAAEIAAAMKG